MARQPTRRDAKSMAARSPDDSAGEHNNGSGMQDTGAAMTNDAAKAKGMTAWSAAKPLGEQLVLFVRMEVRLQQHGL